MNGETNEARANVAERQTRAAAHLYMTVPEVAELLRTTKTAIYTMVQRGQLPGVRRVGRRILVRRSAVVRWIEESGPVDSNGRDDVRSSVP